MWRFLRNSKEARSLGSVYHKYTESRKMYLKWRGTLKMQVKNSSTAHLNVTLKEARRMNQRYLVDLIERELTRRS